MESLKGDVLKNKGKGSGFSLPSYGWVGVLGTFPHPSWAKYRATVSEGAREEWGPGESAPPAGSKEWEGGNKTDAAYFEALHGVEKRFFTEHPAYKEAAGTCGAEYLLTLVQSILVATVRRYVPNFRKLIMDAMEEPKLAYRKLAPLTRKKEMTDSLMKVARALKFKWDFQVRPHTAPHRLPQQQPWCVTHVTWRTCVFWAAD